MTRPLPRDYLLSTKKCCRNGCTNCPYRLPCDKCNKVNIITFEAEAFICWNCGQGSEYVDNFKCRRTENNSLFFEDGEVS